MVARAFILKFMVSDVSILDYKLTGVEQVPVFAVQASYVMMHPALSM